MNNDPDPTSKMHEDEALDPRAVAEWIGRAKQGDDDAFGLLVKAFHQRLHGVVYRFVNNSDDANELEQQTWITVWRTLHTFQGKSEFFTWLYRIATYVSLDFLRRRQRQREDEFMEEVEPHREWGAELPASANPRPDREVERDEIRVRFQQVLDRLTPEHRMALVLREVEGMSYEQIAQAMKCRKGTVMSRIYYARKNIQEHMQDLL